MHPGNRHYVIFEVSEIDRIDFSQVVEDAASTVRRNIAGTHAIVKYEGSAPSSIISLTTKSQEYEYSDIINITSGTDWTPADPEMDI